jgi:toxin ParE1/3/4
VAEERVRRLRLAPEAKRDIRRIWHEGSARWSAVRADAYVSDLSEVFELLVATPAIVRERSEFTPPVRIYTYRSHVIIFRESDDYLDVLRIRHGHEDWAGDLSD